MDDGGSKTRLAEACGGVLTTLGVICLSTTLESAVLGVIGTQGVDVRGEWLAVGAVVSVAARPMEPREGGPSCAADAA